MRCYVALINSKGFVGGHLESLQGGLICRWYLYSFTRYLGVTTRKWGGLAYLGQLILLKRQGRMGESEFDSLKHVPTASNHVIH